MTGLEEVLTGLIPDLVPNLARKFPTLPAEDIESQCWLGTLEHREQLEAVLGSGDVNRTKANAKDYATKAVLAMRREQDRHDRAVKALASGFEPEDQRHYSTGLLKVILPSYLDNGVTAEPPRGREIQPSRTGDPAETGTWLATMIDVDYAWWKIRDHHRKVLKRYFAYPQGPGGWTHLEIASAMGINPQTLRGRVDRALKSMQRILGGPNPWLKTRRRDGGEGKAETGDRAHSEEDSGEDGLGYAGS